MQYISAKEIAEKWGVSPILVRRLCRQGRVPGAVQKKDGWSIPEDAVREERTVLEYTEEPELPELAKKLQNQKKKRNFYGLYDFVVIDLTYSSFPYGKLPFDPSAGGNHLPERENPGVLRAYEGVRCDRGPEPYPLRQLYSGSCDGTPDPEVHPETP